EPSVPTPQRDPSVLARAHTSTRAIDTTRAEPTALATTSTPSARARAATSPASPRRDDAPARRDTTNTRRADATPRSDPAPAIDPATSPTDAARARWRDKLAAIQASPGDAALVSALGAELEAAAAAITNPERRVRIVRLCKAADITGDVSLLARAIDELTRAP
ncbi:hypothetical protein L6R52_36555, partial [Myxococcota bacterium]|nr:hypothetical protein [Myxococcota bacterium]